MTDLSQLWRPIQFFLDSDPMSVAEVQARKAPLDDENNVLLFRCTCKHFAENQMEPCRHIQVVFARVLQHGGGYVTRMRRTDIDPELLFAARFDPAAYRHLLVHESDIEVLDAQG